MNALVFVDTNVLLYRHDIAKPGMPGRTPR